MAASAIDLARRSLKPSLDQLACSSIHRRRKHLGVSNTWSDEARERKRAAGRPATLTLGTPAARISPRSGPYETNINAKTWIVISPTGEEYTVRNLRLWCDSNANLFAPHEPRKAIGGLRQVAAWLAGKRRRQVSQWRGWTLKDMPVPGDKSARQARSRAGQRCLDETE